MVKNNNGGSGDRKSDESGSRERRQQVNESTSKSDGVVKKANTILQSKPAPPVKK